MAKCDATKEDRQRTKKLTATRTPRFQSQMQSPPSGMCVLWMLACRLTTLSMTLMNGDVLDDKKYGHSSSGCFAFG